MSLCNVTGIIHAPDGELVPNAQVLFRRRDAVLGLSGVTIVPKEVIEMTDELSAIDVDLYPGAYRVQVEEAGVGAWGYNVTVPPAAEADMSSIIGGQAAFLSNAIFVDDVSEIPDPYLPGVPYVVLLP